MGMSANSATNNSDLGNLGDFWRDGADSSQKMDTLAGRRGSSTPKRGSPRLAKPHTRQVSARS